MHSETGCTSNHGNRIRLCHSTLECAQNGVNLRSSFELSTTKIGGVSKAIVVELGNVTQNTSSARKEPLNNPRRAHDSEAILPRSNEKHCKCNN